MNVGAAQPVPSDTTYKNVYQTTFLNSWRDHPAKEECCKKAHHLACQHWGLNCCFSATSVPNEWQEYYCEFHFSGTGGHSADGLLFQCLWRCTNVILPSVRNSDLMDNECLAANISITATPAWAITRVVTIVFWFNILHHQKMATCSPISQ
jgi:hypothetical protein